MMRALIGIALAGLLGAFGHPEHRISTTRKVGELATRRSYATATPYDGGFLVAWEDGRFGPASVQLGTPQITAFASRITAQGTTLDPAGFRVSTAPFDQSDPAPGCIDVHCIIVWQQSTRGVWMRAYNAATDVWGPETVLNPVTASWVTPRVGVVGNRFLVTWPVEGTGLVSRFVAADGTPEAALVTLVNAGSPLGWSVASNGTTFLVTWTDDTAPYAVNAQVFSAAGVRVAAPVRVGTSSTCALVSTCDPVSAAVGSTYLVAWRDGSGRLTMIRVNETGATVPPATQPLGGKTGRSALTATVEGTDFVVGWVEAPPQNEVHGARLNEDLTVVIADQLLRTEADPPSLLRFSAVRNGQALATWSVRSRLRSSLLGVADGGLVMLDAGFVTQTRPDVHFGPRVARLGSGFVTVWNSVVDDGGVPMARVLDRIGQPVAAPVVLDPSALEVYGVDVSYDGTATWAAWATAAEVKVAQLDSVGQPLGVVEAVSSRSVLSPHLAHRGPQTLVTWAWDQGHDGYGVSGRMLDAQGRLAGPVLLLTSAGTVPRHAIAASATQFGFAWATPPGYQLYFSTIAADGGLTQPPVGPIATSASWVALASNGTDFLLTWNPPGPGAVQAVRISASRAVLDSTPLTVSAPQLALNAGNLSLADVSFDGTNYQLTWAEVVADGGALDVHQRSIASDGTLGPVEVVAGGPRYQHGPARTAGTVGRSLVAWVDSDEGGDEVMRVRARAYAALPVGEACVAAAECLDGECVNETCCNPLDGGCVTRSDGGTDAGIDAGIDRGGPRPRALAVGCDCSSIPTVTFVGFALLGTLLRARSRRSRKV